MGSSILVSTFQLLASRTMTTQITLKLSRLFQIKLSQPVMGHRASTTVSPPKQRPGVESSEELLISSLALLPSYGVLFRDTQTAIFSESGPLPIPTRHFIALMVRFADCRQCRYLLMFDSLTVWHPLSFESVLSSVLCVLHLSRVIRVILLCCFWSGSLILISSWYHHHDWLRPTL